ncbi:MAG: glucose-6-phosphate dehydrogenase [Actinomycetota bacterium]|nr:MAG: glucose-6-phosphate [Actinomycetota bacterium]MDP3630166.1 glucose-6-phosphate dehydrogenase [Actinomycetota bacterium]
MTTPESNRPTILTVFGATGDLMARKIVPSLAYLQVKGRLPERFRVIGFSRRDWSDDDLRDHVRGILDAYQGLAPEGDAREAFLGMFTYQRGTFDDGAAYEALAADVQAIDDTWGLCSSKLYYLAVPPENYRTIFERLSASGLTQGCSDDTGWTRVLVEKPFGRDGATAQELDELLGSLFAEEQVYRIDHYLAKEMLQGIMSFRFSNTLFEPSWDAGSIDRIDITLLESIGVEKRGAFYDGVGALRDVGQNHLLQMLALVLMDRPRDLSAESIRANRVRFLEDLRAPSADDIAAYSFRAQYDGYREITGVDPCSDTETYFRLRFALHGGRWGGVPVTMESGKRMGTPLKEIAVTFRAPEACLCDAAGPGHFENRVTFRLEPEESIKIEFWAKKPGFERELELREFTFFLYEKEEKVQYVEEYAKLLLDAIAGDQTLFVATDEVRAMWAFIDPFTRAWGSGAVPLETYTPDSSSVTALARERVDASPVAKLEIGVAGLGKMGANLARNLIDHRWRVVGWNRTNAVAEAMEAEGLEAVESLADLVAALDPPRTVWLMVPSGAPVDQVLFGEGGLASLLEPGDTVIDGGNSHYIETIERAPKLAALGLRFLDSGTSGGPGGARNGACLMVGGERADFDRLEHLWRDASVRDGYRFFDGHGAGHFVKMVHNGIEYGMMEAIAEGFAIMKRSPFQIDLDAAAEVYNRGSVIESRLVGWLEDAFRTFGQDLESVSGTVASTGEGEWTVKAAEALGVDARVIRDALEVRRESETAPSYAGRVLSALRNRFGGHAIG